MKKIVLTAVAVALVAAGAFALGRAWSSEETSDEPITTSSNLLTYDETRTALVLVWAEKSYNEQEELCQAYDILGPADAYNSFTDGMNNGKIPNQNAFHDFFREVC